MPGQINSIFFEIFFKSLKKEIKSPIIIICSVKLFNHNARKYKYKGKYNLINYDYKDKFFNNSIYLINVKIKTNKQKITQLIDNNEYIKECFKIAFKLLKNKITNKILNGPINKKNFFKKKYLGVTEFIGNYFNKKNIGMLIYNKNLSVCPITTHLPIKLISKKITKKLINKKLILIDNFFRKNFKYKPRIGVTGLNPHCESILTYNEDEKIIAPAIKNSQKKGILASGPYSADTIFLKQNRKKFDVIVGMYHDQVLTPLKTLFEYDAINITMGLPFLRVSPDHGPNEKMLDKNLSSPISLIRALNFLDKN